jgi:hypothetical protein
VFANGGGVVAVGACPGKGRGVFAQRKISRGEPIEEAPVVVVPQPQIEHLDQTVLGDYYFVWGPDEEHAALALGLCSLCNHSYQANAVFRLKSEQLAIEFVAARDIEIGEEITINYNGDLNSRKPIWFDCLP